MLCLGRRPRWLRGELFSAVIWVGMFVLTGVVCRKKSFMSKFKKDKEPATTKAVWMPRREYKKFFAKDNEGKYIGTEPQREWTEEELEEEFGQYQKEV